jgi:hypothetical protein
MCERELQFNIIQPEKRYGYHVMLRDTLYDTVSLYPHIPCLQFYLGNPSILETKDITCEDREKTSNYCLDTNKSLYVRCPEVVNLSKKDCVNSYMLVAKQLDTISEMPASCVISVGKKGIRYVAQHINQLQTSGFLPLSTFEKNKFKLLVEMNERQDWDDIRHLFEAIDYTRVGLCIGMKQQMLSDLCSFETHKDIVKLFDISNSISKHSISLLHLNNNASPHIRKENDEGLQSLLQMCYAYGIDVIEI